MVTTPLSVTQPRPNLEEKIEKPPVASLKGRWGFLFVLLSLQVDRSPYVWTVGSGGGKATMSYEPSSVYAQSYMLGSRQQAG